MVWHWYIQGMSADRLRLKHVNGRFECLYSVIWFININQFQSILHQYQSYSCMQGHFMLFTFPRDAFRFAIPKFLNNSTNWNLALEEPRLQDFHFWSGEMSCWAKIRNVTFGARECARIRIRMVLNQRRSKEYLFQIQLATSGFRSKFWLNGRDHRSCRVL